MATIHNPQFAVLTAFDERCLLEWFLGRLDPFGSPATELRSPG